MAVLHKHAAKPRRVSSKALRIRPLKCISEAVLVLCFVLLLAQVALASDASGFDDSSGPSGQQSWGSLIRQEREVCNTGQMQSPIDIKFRDLQLVFATRLLQARSNLTSATLTNIGLNVELAFPENAGTLVIDGIFYQLADYHIHMPSEHTVNGTRYDMEGHLVHMSSDGKIAVVGIFYRIGEDDDAFIKQFEDVLPALIATDVEEPLDHVDPSKLQITGNKFYRYNGSLTTPPCDEGVTWSILTEPRTLSHKQYELLRDALKEDNARSLQSLNGRNVFLYISPKLFDIKLSKTSESSFV